MPGRGVWPDRSASASMGCVQSPSRPAGVEQSCCRVTDLVPDRVQHVDNGDGRFLTADLLWSMAPGASPYVYCESDPVNLSDPLGLVGSTPITYDGPDPTPAGLHEDRLTRQRELDARQLRGPVEQ